MKLLVDHNLPPVMARAVHLLVEKDGHEVVALRDRFRPDCADIEWLGRLGMEGGWSILSQDYMIMRRPAERLALNRARVTAYFLAPGWAKLTNLEKDGAAASLVAQVVAGIGVDADRWRL